MEIRFFSSYSRQKELFEPLETGHVCMYTCGPTVYDFVHIGNFRTFVFEDLLRRALKFLGFRVTQVMNITDIEDKIIKASREKGVSIQEHTAPYTAAFFEDLSLLNMERAEFYPKATEHIPLMIDLIQKLLDKGFAYRPGDSVYFDISKFPAYGKLSRIKPAKEREFSRLEADEYEKEETTDFVLWKGRREGEPYWESPFGPGRPGWHIECSAMSMHYLGETFDIHTGGVDNMFPHHENEIAQSEAATGRQFVRFWLHSNHLMVEGERMAKSKGNFYTLRDLLKKGYNGKAIRFLLLSTHYRNPLNFTFTALDQAGKNVERLQDFSFRLTEYRSNGPDFLQLAQIFEERKREFAEALADDLNISGALAALFSFMRDLNPLLLEGKLSSDDAARALDLFRDLDRVLGVLEQKEEVEEGVLRLIEERAEARKNKDFTRADQIRRDLESRGILLEDTLQGTRWRKAR